MTIANAWRSWRNFNRDATKLEKAQARGSFYAGALTVVGILASGGDLETLRAELMTAVKKAKKNPCSTE